MSYCPKVSDKGFFNEDCLEKPHKTKITIESNNNCELLEVSTPLSNAELKQVIRSKLEGSYTFIWTTNPEVNIDT